MSLLPHRRALLVPPWLIDSDARDFISRVQAADGNSLENGVKIAYSNFIRGCKADGTWNAIKASCILAGARTLSGALVPLVGTAPTNLNFVSGDYNRKTGLVGNGSTKYLNSNRNNNADPQDSSHNAVFVSTAGTINNGVYIAGDTVGAPGSNMTRQDITGGTILSWNRISIGGASFATSSTVEFIGTSRSASAVLEARAAGTTNSYSQISSAPLSVNVTLFARNPASPNTFNNGRIAFYSIGESLNLALLGARVTALINAFAAVIP